MNRSQRLAVLGGFVSAVGAVYACTTNGTVTPSGPPVNEDGGDSSTPVTTDGGDSGPVTGDGSPNPSDSGGDAGVACESLPGTIVYIESADTQEALLDTVGRQLRDNANITLVFLLTGSCTVTPNIYGTGTGPVPLAAGTSMLYIPSSAENPTWTPADPENSCTTSKANTPQLGISALFPQSCSTYAPPANTNITQFLGPRQAYTFIVPPAEFTGGQQSISASEAYYAFGFGAANPVTVGAGDTAEWNDPAQFFLRPSTKSTLVSTALNIHLTPAQMTDVGADGGTVDGRQLVASSTGVLDDIAAATSAQAIGILGDEVYDQNRSKVNILAFQDTVHGQTAAYFPDSTQTSFDKQNIRDGHYSLWSPDVYMVPTTDAGTPADPNVGFLLDIIEGNPGATLPDGGTGGGIDGISITASVGLTPNCAMQVTRAGDGYPLTANAAYSTNPCTCKFLSSIPGATDGGLPSTCTACTTSSQCPSSGYYGCFNGYCEAIPTALATDGGCTSATTGENACTSATPAPAKQVNLPDDGGFETPVPQ